MYILLVGIYPFISFLWQIRRRITKNIITGKLSFDSDKFNDISEEAKDLIKFFLFFRGNVILVMLKNVLFFIQIKE
jgi:hypothetical protein